MHSVALHNLDFDCKGSCVHSFAFSVQTNTSFSQYKFCCFMSCKHLDLSISNLSEWTADFRKKITTVWIDLFMVVLDGWRIVGKGLEIWLVWGCFWNWSLPEEGEIRRTVCRKVELWGLYILEQLLRKN